MREISKAGELMQRLSALAFVGVLLSGCAMPRGASNSIRPPAASAPPEPSEITLTDSVFAADASSAWIFAREGLYAVTAKGLAKSSFEAKKDWSTAAMTVSGSQITVALVFDGITVQIAQSSDAAAQWTQLPAVDVSTINGISTLTVGATESTTVVLADESSSNVSSGMTATTRNAGKTWRTLRAPTGGHVASVDGAFWLVGGVVGDDVFASTDGETWAPAGPKLEGDWTAGMPWTLTAGTVVLPVTAHSEDSSVMTLWTTGDKHHWVQGASIEAAPTEVGVSLPVAGGSDGAWVFAQSDGSKVFAGSLNDGEPRTISPNGLPAGIVQLARIGDSTVVAYGMASACPDGKASCTGAAGVWYSIDLGQTWARLGFAG
jgi:hypothetical protein